LLWISVKIEVLETASEGNWNMSSNIHVSDEVSRLYEKLQIKRDKLKEQLDEVEKEFVAVSTTLKLMGLPTPGMSNLTLTGKTHLEALIEIAKANGNILVVKTARRLMTRAGMFGNPKNASSVLFTAISRSGKFRSLSKGKYELIEEIAKPASIPEPSQVTSIEFDLTPTSHPKRA
jgi:hypothetical protein